MISAMWDYADIPKRRAALAELTDAERATLTWADAGKFLRCDTMAMAMWQGLSKRQEGTPFEAVCVANGFYDLLRNQSPPTAAADART
jgi:hypothetical protein